MPDPERTREVLSELLSKIQDFMRSGSQFMSEPAQPLPFDPMDVGRALSAFSLNLMMNPARAAEETLKWWQGYNQIVQTTSRRIFGQDATPSMEPASGDRRFKAPEWSEDPYFDYLKQSYLLLAQRLQDLVNETDGLDKATKAKVDFVVRQYINAISPSNFAYTNPVVIKKTLESGGLNLLTGLANLLEDLSRRDGLVKYRMTAEFELGVTIASTAGSVVFQNAVMQLIQYKASTDKVYSTPILFVPPIVNKYYLFDLRPESSFLKWLVDQGYTVFVISWVNPDRDHADISFADYLKHGPVAALDAIEMATGVRDVNIVGYCIGGTLIATGLAYLAAKGDNRIKSASLFATLTDFSELGDFTSMVDEGHSSAMDNYLSNKGFVESHDLARLFSVVRANDLIWSSVINHYLLGEKVFPSDMMFWFADGARIPAETVRYYVRNIVQENLLRVPGGITIDDVPIDLGKIRIPVTIVSFKEDHVSAWKSTYKTAGLLSGETRFLLGGSGHNAGMINPPKSGKHNYWVNLNVPGTADEWLAGATEHRGSWWPEWETWLRELSGAQVAARLIGSKALKPIEPAPGSYARVRT
jgi:polyhydroxyalkanoate synthase